MKIAKEHCEWPCGATWQARVTFFSSSNPNGGWSGWSWWRKRQPQKRQLQLTANISHRSVTIFPTTKTLRGSLQKNSFFQSLLLFSHSSCAICVRDPTLARAGWSFCSRLLMPVPDAMAVGPTEMQHMGQLVAQLTAENTRNFLSSN